MVALILNSGMGTRMGDITAEHPKCMTDISSRETILSRQLRQLYDEGVKRVVITTGMYDEKLISYVDGLDIPMDITYVKNDRFRETNYIYSIYLARKYLKDDILLMHGDLVFDDQVLDMVLNSRVSCMVVSSSTELPEKDFKAVVKDERIVRVGIDCFENAYAAQPLYLIKKNDWSIWMDAIKEYCESGIVEKLKCYAENAFNEVSDRCLIYPLDIKDLFCGEIDDLQDLKNVSTWIAERRRKTVYMAFSSDFIHGGHIKIIKRARRLGKLIIGVISDEGIRELRKYPLLTFEDRRLLFENIEGVSKVVEQKTLSYRDVLEEIRPDIVVHGTDWIKGPQEEIRSEVIEVLSSYGGELVEFPYSDDPKYRGLDEGEIQIVDPQIELSSDEDYRDIDVYLDGVEAKRILLVGGKSMKGQKAYNHIAKSVGEGRYTVTEFSDFKENPEYSSTVNGVRAFKDNECDGIVAIGGGSAIDVAKCVRAFLNMNPDVSYLTQEVVPNSIPLLAIPTTAGSGSEATSFAVIYQDGRKQSISGSSLIPDAFILDDSTLESLPVYHRKATAFDALMHATEGFWSVNATDESRQWSKEAIEIILANIESYLEKGESRTLMMKAANLAGKAINVAKTTAGHAMSYGVTEKYGIAHGHAAALCDVVVWPYMLEHTEKLAGDDKVAREIRRVLDELDEIYLGAVSGDCELLIPGEGRTSRGYQVLDALIRKCDLYGVPGVSVDDADELAATVNQERLKNNPVIMSREDVREAYRRMLEMNRED